MIVPNKLTSTQKDPTHNRKLATVCYELLDITAEKI